MLQNIIFNLQDEKNLTNKSFTQENFIENNNISTNYEPSSELKEKIVITCNVPFGLLLMILYRKIEN